MLTQIDSMAGNISHAEYWFKTRLVCLVTKRTVFSDPRTSSKPIPAILRPEKSRLQTTLLTTGDKNKLLEVSNTFLKLLESKV